MLAEAKTSAGAPASICVRRVRELAKLKVTSVPGLADSKAAPISEKASVSDEAANTVSVPGPPRAAEETPVQPARIAHESAN